MQQVYAFDFDGTLTRSDTLLAFIRHACGRWAMLWGFLCCLPWIVLMIARLYPNYKAKQRLFAHFFKGWTLARFDEECRSFAHTHGSVLRPQGMATLRKALAQGAEVAIVSASIDNWVKPFFTELIHNGASLIVLGTKIESIDGIVTGRFSTPNCYGAEKVRRIREAFPKRDEYRFTAYGDSRGDKEMLDYADQKYYKPFR